jgi:hypothetical protein
MNDIDRSVQQEHPQLRTLPEWPTATIAVLATVDDGLHAIPVSAPLRTEDRRILLSLRRSRGSLARLRKHARVALTVLTEGNIAITPVGGGRRCDRRRSRPWRSQGVFVGRWLARPRRA